MHRPHACCPRNPMSDRLAKHVSRMSAGLLRWQSQRHSIAAFSPGAMSGHPVPLQAPAYLQGAFHAANIQQAQCLAFAAASPTAEPRSWRHTQHASGRFSLQVRSTAEDAATQECDIQSTSAAVSLLPTIFAERPHHVATVTPQYDAGGTVQLLSKWCRQERRLGTALPATGHRPLSTTMTCSPSARAAAAREPRAFQPAYMVRRTGSMEISSAACIFEMTALVG